MKNKGSFRLIEEKTEVESLATIKGYFNIQILPIPIK